MFVRQNGGTGLNAGFSPLNITGLRPVNGVSDPSGDGKYEAGGIISANMPQLDILSSNVSKVTTAPCSAAQPCYKVAMQLNNLSLAPTIAQDSNTDLVWLTQWLVPSKSDGTGGRNFHVYAESNNGAALQCFFGQNAAATNGAGFSLAYPGGLTPLPAANCQSTLGPNGTITIFVPLSSVSVADPIDDRLHEVTASTMTLTQPANSNPDLLGSGLAGSLFNLIDVAPAYVVDPAPLKIVSITHLPNGHILLQCLGIPDQLNTIETSPDLLTPFTPLGSVMADVTGVFQFEDTNAGSFAKRFYRLAYP